MNKLTRLFHEIPLKIIGIGITAFNRVGPAYFLPDYEIICYKDSWDVSQIKKKCKVVSVERDFEGDLKKLNSLAILKHKGVQSYLKGKREKLGIFFYKSTKRIERICDKNGWQIITNRSEIRDPYENKKVFREVLEKVGIEPVPGEILPISDFNEQVFEKFQKKYGKKMVLQLPEVTKGGGQGNTFINKKENLGVFWEKVKRLGKDFKIQNVIVAKFIKGVSPSIIGCVTRHGVLTSVVQTQITDIPEVINTKRGAGLFVGHDWSYRHYPAKIQLQAERIAKKFGEYISKKGYKGIFGIDLLVEEGTEKVYACECNPRYTGAFPVYSMMQTSLGEPSFDIFQLLEHLDIDYRMDFKEVDACYKQKKEGSQLILYNKTGDYLKVGEGIKGGVYKISNFQFPISNLEFVRDGFVYEDIKSDEEFVLTDGVPRRGAVIRPGLRILKIIFPGRILAENGKEIDKRTRLIAKEIYGKLRLRPKEP